MKLILKDILGVFEVDLKNGSIKEVENTNDYINISKNNKKYKIESKFNKKVIYSPNCLWKIEVIYSSEIIEGTIHLKRIVKLFFGNFLLSQKSFSFPFFSLNPKKVLEKYLNLLNIIERFLLKEKIYSIPNFKTF